MSDKGVVPVEQLRAMIALLCPDHMTPIAKRQLESICKPWGIPPLGTTSAKPDSEATP